MSDLDVYTRQNFGNRLGFGERPGLIVVDFVNGFNDPQLFGGGNIDAAIRRTVGLLAACRNAGLPIVFTRIVYADDGSDAGLFMRKAPGLKILTETHPSSQVVPELAPRPGEYILRKTQASSFLGTGLAGWLVGRGVDTVIVAGCTTSGCVRATVVDAIGLGFRPIVVTDCVGDRAQGPHDANLFDLGQKYADLMDRDAVIAEIGARTRHAAE